jgi:histidine ammonia-lyase
MEINGSELKLEHLRPVILGGEKFSLSSGAKSKVLESRAYIEKRIAKGDVMYGVNTGFGPFSSVNISPTQIKELQVNLIRSHCVGIGVPYTREETRAIMCLRANALARGHSGVRPVVIEKIFEFLEKDVLPVIPSQGSVGASGDLAPLAHLALGLLGEGKVWSDVGPVSAAETLRTKKIEPLRLEAKEGLSLINGCQVMTAVGGLQLLRAAELCRIADILGAMSLEGLRGSRAAFHPIISASRPHEGERKTARNLLRILSEDSEIAKSHENCHKVQDVYSLRCMPAVHGAVKDVIRNAVKTLEIEANSSTDNPLVFAEEDLVLSCGNFHGEPVAFQMDFAAIAMSELANISERRIAKLINPVFSDLPTFLTNEGGLNSGMMIVQYAAASLVSENKVFSHPASVDSIPTSAEKEDHVSMGTTAARKLRLIIENTTNVLAMEALCALTALRMLAPMKPAAGALAAMNFLSDVVPPIEKDRVFSTDIENIRTTLLNGEFLRRVEGAIGGLEW